MRSHSHCVGVWAGEGARGVCILADFSAVLRIEGSSSASDCRMNTLLVMKYSFLPSQCRPQLTCTSVTPRGHSRFPNTLVTTAAWRTLWPDLKVKCFHDHGFQFLLHTPCRYQLLQNQGDLCSALVIVGLRIYFEVDTSASKDRDG